MPTDHLETVELRAKRYRVRAAELRRQARLTTTLQQRTALLEKVLYYERLATGVERWQAR